MSERQEGWYHTKLDGVWGCCEYYNGEWVVLDKAFTDHWFDEIGPRIPSPDEPWVTVPVEQTDKMYRRLYWHMVTCSGKMKDIWGELISSAPKP